MKHTSFFKEILQQPSALQTLLECQAKKDFESLREACRLLDGAQRIILTGMGTSFYAPLVMLDSFMCRNVIHLEAGELYEYHRELLAPGTVLLMISQSGESVEIKRILACIPEGCQVIGIINDPASTLAAQADCVLLLNAGIECTITNRTFTNTLALLELLVCPHAERAALCRELVHTSEQMEEYLKDPAIESAAEHAADTLLPANQAYFIGRGSIGQVCALQSALIFTEGAHCAARGLTTGMFHHGPMEICDENLRAVMFVQDDIYREKTIMLCEQMASHGGHVVLIGSAGPQSVATIPIPHSSIRSFPYLAILASEILLVATAEKRGREAGHFLIGHKITTED